MKTCENCAWLGMKKLTPMYRRYAYFWYPCCMKDNHSVYDPDEETCRNFVERTYPEVEE